MLFIVNQYFETLNRDHHGNPLITAFPSLNRETVEQLMSNVVHFDPAERDHPGELRIQYVMRLLNFFLPLDHQTEFCLKLWSLICHGYRQRHPLKPATHDSFARLMQSINAGAAAPSTDGTAFDAMLCALLLGTPGTGKTTSVKALLSRLGPGLLHHKLHGELYQLLYLTVQAPKNGSAKALAQEIFNSLRAAAMETGLPMPYLTGRPPKTEAELTQAITVLAQKLNLGILVLDELQHLYRGISGMDNDAMKFLTGVINRLGIPVLMIGTWECYGLLGLEARIARRATGTADAQYRRLQNDQEWRIFLDTLLSHQFTRIPVELTDDLADTFYFHTQGIQDLAVKLLVVSQIDAILDETEQLTHQSVDASATRHMSLIANIVRMIREGRRDTDPTLWDLEPSDLDGYLTAFAARAGTSLRRSVDRKAFNLAKSAGKTDAVAASLIATGDVPTEDAFALAALAVAAAPEKPASDHVENILKDTNRLAPRPTKAKSSKRQREVSDEIMAFQDADLRKILFLATRDKVDADTVSAAFEESGHLCLLLEDLPC